MKNTINIKVKNESEYKEYRKTLLNRGFTLIGTRLFEDSLSYVRVNIE